MSAQLGGRRQSRPSAEDPPRPRAPAGGLCAFVLGSDLENLNSAFLPGLPTASPLGREGLFPREWPRGDPAGTRRRLRRGRLPRRRAVAASGEPCCCSPGDWRSPRVCRGRLDREARPLAQAGARCAGSPPPGLPHPEPQACPRWRGLGRRPWRRPRVVVALRGARSSVPGAAYCVWGVVFRELSGTVSIAVSRYQEALFSN